MEHSEKNKEAVKEKRPENLSDELKSPSMDYKPGQKLPGDNGVKPVIMKEHVLAHALLDVLSGLEIGAAEYNPFGFAEFFGVSLPLLSNISLFIELKGNSVTYYSKRLDERLKADLERELSKV